MDARIDSLRERAATLRALLKVLDDPQPIIRLAAESASSAEFYAGVMRDLSLGPSEARAIADMQVRNFFSGTRHELEADLAQVEAALFAGGPEAAQL